MTAVAPHRGQPTARRSFSPLRLAEALATPHPVDRYLELVHPMLTVRELRARVVDVRRVTGDSIALTLRPTRQWRGFRAGQFVQVTVDIDGVRRTRCYSLSGSQHRADGLVEITVKAHRDGLVSRYLYENGSRGLVVGLTPADGEFVLPERRPERLLLISGGSGITPVLSMLRTLCDEGHRGEVVFLHYARDAADVAHRAELEDLAARHPNVRLVLCFTRGDGELTGHFIPAHLDSAAAWHRDAEVYACGPSGLLEAVTAHYDACGLADRLHVERFVLGGRGAGRGSAGGTVSFTRTGTTAPNSGDTLLEQAEAAGLSPEYGCRMGICFSCTQRKASGCTRDIRTGETDSDPDTEIQLCINVPVGDVELAI